jgi:hypothetical protein
MEALEEDASLLETVQMPGKNAGLRPRHASQRSAALVVSILIKASRTLRLSEEYAMIAI